MKNTDLFYTRMEMTDNPDEKFRLLLNYLDILEKRVDLLEYEVSGVKNYNVTINTQI